MNRKLIILGNGFDLHCKLKSAFRDFFFEKEIPLIERWARDLNHDAFNEIDFVSLLLYNTFYRPGFKYETFDLRTVKVDFQSTFKKEFKAPDTAENWMDVEGFLCNFLNSPGISKIVSCFNSIFIDDSRISSTCICPSDLIPEFFQRAKRLIGYFQIKDFYVFLMKELQRFEKRFAAYLEEISEENPVYKSKSRNTIRALTGNDSTGTILNFNYTRTNPGANYKEINVHGSIYDAIIIGVDSKEMKDESKIPFTKTFRKLITPGNKAVLDADFDEIVIYGHSLGPQDYSYFLSIFDYVDLYGGHASVKFIYSDDFVKEDPSDPTCSKQQHGKDMAKKLFSLIDTYGRSLNRGGKDSGQNLTHKLILEGRLKLELNNFPG